MGTIVIYALVLATLAAVIFFGFPRFFEFVIDVAAVVLIAFEDAAKAWKELFRRLRGR